MVGGGGELAEGLGHGGEAAVLSEVDGDQRRTLVGRHLDRLELLDPAPASQSSALRGAQVAGRTATGTLRHCPLVRPRTLNVLSTDRAKSLAMRLPMTRAPQGGRRDSRVEVGSAGEPGSALDVIAYVAANALIGVHRALIDLVRHRVLADDATDRLAAAAADVRAYGTETFALLARGLADYGVRRASYGDDA